MNKGERVELMGSRGAMGTVAATNEDGTVLVRWDEDDSETWVWESQLLSF